jgi:hypothetical protein
LIQTAEPEDVEDYEHQGLIILGSESIKQPMAHSKKQQLSKQMKHYSNSKSGSSV